MKHHHVAQLTAMIEAAQHAHDRRDAAAGADEEQLVRRRVGQDELALHVAQEHELTRLELAVQEGRHLA